jgi:hypothetical protein
LPGISIKMILLVYELFYFNELRATEADEYISVDKKKCPVLKCPT